MKISYISTSRIPSRTANSIHVMKMCNAFAALGHDVTLFSSARDRSDHDDVADIYDFYGVEPVFGLRRIRQRGGLVGRHLYGVFAALWSVLNAPDVIYTRDLTAAFVLCLLGRNVVYESHAPADGTAVKRFLVRWLFRKRSLQRVVVITHALRRYYEDVFPFLAGRILVAPDAADPLPGDINAVAFEGKGERLQVGYTGHLYPGKGMETVAALAPLASWADFHVVGGTPADIDRWKRQGVASDNLIFHGFHPHSDVPAFLCAFDVLLLPNRKVVLTDGYGGAGGKEALNISDWTSPLKAFEYMSTGKPILVSDLPALREVFEDGQNALLCDPEQPEDWLNKLTMLRDDSELRHTLGAEALGRFLEKYTWRARARQIAEVF